MREILFEHNMYLTALSGIIGRGSAANDNSNENVRATLPLPVQLRNI